MCCARGCTIVTVAYIGSLFDVVAPLLFMHIHTHRGIVFFIHFISKLYIANYYIVWLITIVNFDFHIDSLYDDVLIITIIIIIIPSIYYYFFTYYMSYYNTKY